MPTKRPKKRERGAKTSTYGRPPLPEGERKDATIKVRVTEAQRTAFAEAAEAAMLDVATWLRTLGAREVERRKSHGGTG